MIASLVQHEYNVEAAKLFNKMRREGSKPNQFTLSSVISAATDMGDCEYGNSIHACVWKLGFDMDNTVGNSLVRMYTKNGFLEDGFRVFDAMTDQDSVSWNALLSGFHDGDACGEGPRVFNHMLTEGFKPNKYTFISTLRSCSSMSNLHYGQQLHGQIIKNDLAIDNFMETALVDMYAKCCCLEDALEVFNKMKERDTFTWTTIITGCAQNNHGETAIRYFRQMQREGVCPNEFTLSSYLRACCAMAALENGRQLHSRVIKSGQSDDLIVMSALVDMYCKCGCLKDAEAVFNNLVSRDTVAWNTIICGYSQHGQGKKALDAFQGMLDEGVLPDRITFIGVLSACSHVGLVEEGRRYFDSLSNSYGIAPTIEHYACMVDILGRAGKLGEVEKFIEKMPLTPDSLIWQTVLGACCKHGNMDLGEKAAEQLLELEPQMDSTYILLSNIYASKGRWKDVSKVRAKMSSQGVKKEPGCSWVEVDGQVHVFLPNDASHPMVPEIYQKLEELGQDLVSAGYIPNTDYVHHNVSHGEKVKSLLYHSERLALAFAIISGGLQKPIRIFKNLRICGDCHNAVKLISNITNREIIIRDVSRFHHFQNGSCSCQDYW
ncbi:hypothetical protein Scep_002606 [Stephania cephalantha]|uniref:DYW domain-containing protein n=1 Tax=Stephania cephalantha TaxID=152367 RepID=A0AAP0LD09_9MAGN